MTDLNPLTGKLYLEALQMTRVAREAYVLLGGKYPHPETIVPGGVTTTISTNTLTEFYMKIQNFFDYSKKVIGIWDDIFDFLYDCDARYLDCGRLPATMLDNGQWDHEDHYDATYANCNAWGEKRWSTPGIVVEGKLVSTRLTDINVGLEEFIEHSYYEKWETYPFKTDPLGNPLSPYHPWNKTTIPRPGSQNWKERYSWAHHADLGPARLRSRRLFPRLHLGARQQAAFEQLLRIHRIEPEAQYTEGCGPARTERRVAGPIRLEHIRAKPRPGLRGGIQHDGHHGELGSGAGPDQARRETGRDTIRNSQQGP